MHDVRLAWRSLRQQPLVSIVAVASLALGIGANAALFALFSSLVWRPLPVREPDRLVRLSTGATFGSLQQYSHRTFDVLRARAPFLDGAFAYTSCCGQSILAAGGETTLLQRQYVSGELFSTLGIVPLRGRLLTAADDRAGAPAPVAMISARLWRDQFGAREAAIGSTIVLDRTPLTIVGVTPDEFFGLEVGRAFDVLVPIRLAATLSRTPLDDDTTWLNIVFRLSPRYSRETAAAALRGMQAEISRAAMPARGAPDSFLTTPWTLEPFGAGSSALRERFARPLAALVAVVGLVLLIAAANIGNLLLARGIDRRHEVSVRMALGAPRWTLVRQVLVESSLLTAIGAAGGLLLAWWSVPLIVALLSTGARPITLDVQMDWRLLSFAILVTLITTVLCALVPAWHATRVPPMAFATLRGDGGGGVAGRRTGLTDVLIVSQVALSFVLLVVGALFVQTFERLSQAALGFEPAGVLVARVNASAVPSAQRPAYVDRLVRAVAAVPGVSHAGAALNPPLVGEIVGDYVVAPPGTVPPPGATRIPNVDVISPGWLASYGVPLIAGRDLTAADTQRVPQVMLVNEAFVRALFPSQQPQQPRAKQPQEPLGTTLALTYRGVSGDVPWGTRTIVGVVGDMVSRSVRERPRPAMLIPFAQFPGALPQTTLYLGIKTADSRTGQMPRAIEAALHRLNPELAVAVQPLDRQTGDTLAEDRLVAGLSRAFAALGLLLAALGIYGVTAYAAVRQRRDCGIRLALGASTSSIVRGMFVRVAVLVGVGLTIGGAASLSGAALLRSLLYGVDPRDPIILGASGLMLATVAAIAGALPTWRASRTDPAIVLRQP